MLKNKVLNIPDVTDVLFAHKKLREEFRIIPK